MSKICETRIGANKHPLYSDRFIVVEDKVIIFCDIPALSNVGGKTGVERAIEDMIELSGKYHGAMIISDINDNAVIVDCSITPEEGVALYRKNSQTPEEALQNLLEIKNRFSSKVTKKTASPTSPIR